VSSFTNLSVSRLGLLKVLNYITLLPVVVLFFFCFFLFTRCVSFMLRFVYVCLLLFMCLLFCIYCVIRGLIRWPCGPSPQEINKKIFHVDIFSFQAYLGYKIRRCEWISLKSWNFRPDTKLKHRSTELIWNRHEIMNPVCTQVSLAKKVRGWLTKQAFWSVAHMWYSRICLIRHFKGIREKWGIRRSDELHKQVKTPS